MASPVGDLYRSIAENLPAGCDRSIAIKAAELADLCGMGENVLPDLARLHMNAGQATRAAIEAPYQTRVTHEVIGETIWARVGEGLDPHAFVFELTAALFHVTFPGLR
jgi:hypothetical protein